MCCVNDNIQLLLCASLTHDGIMHGVVLFMDYFAHDGLWSILFAREKSSIVEKGKPLKSSTLLGQANFTRL